MQTVYSFETFNTCNAGIVATLLLGRCVGGNTNTTKGPATGGGRVLPWTIQTQPQTNALVSENIFQLTLVKLKKEPL